MTVNVDSTEKPRLFALLVGVANYVSEIRLANETLRFKKLYGCVEDVHKVKRYLEKDDHYDVRVKTLTDSSASKTAVVDAFLEHFTQATQKDVVLFYFSGHGAQEYVDSSVFKLETDGKSEAIVCYYDEITKSDCLLSDKELRWLIHKISPHHPHIITIFDCCHSEGVTRNAALVQSNFSAAIEKRAPAVFPKRAWSSYLFNAIPEDDFKSKGEYSVLPESPHIELTACVSNEAAMEVQSEGVFTKAMLKVLESSKGQISYRTLHDRVRQYLRGVYEQKAGVNARGTDKDALLSAFLNKPITTAQGMGEVVYNTKLGWQINVGAIHGLTASRNMVTLFDPAEANRTFKATVGPIKTDHAQLSLNGYELDKEKIYRADLRGLLSKIILVHIPSNNAAPLAQLSLSHALLAVAGEFIELVDEEADCDYVLRYQNGFYFITRPNDAFRPLTEVVQVKDDGRWVTEIVEQFSHIAKWTFIKGITNDEEATRLGKNAISVNITTGDPLLPVNTGGIPESIDIPLKEKGQKLVGKIRIEIVNNSANDIFCCAVYLTDSFDSFTGFLNPNVHHLEPKEKVVLLVGGLEELDIVASDKMSWYNWEKIVDCMKFIVSTEKFEAVGLDLEALPGPPVPIEEDVERGGIVREPAGNITFKWQAFDVQLAFLNPNYNRISETALQAMLQFERTNYFALGLYLKSYTIENAHAVYELKPHIQLLNIVNQKNEIMQDDVKEYIKGLEIRSLAPIEDFELKGAVETLEGKDQSFVSNKSIVSFASSVSAKHRNDILDSTLLAQLAANKKFPGENESINWYNSFIEVLSKIGWVVDGSEFSTFKADENIFEMKSAIIKVLTSAFTSDFLGIITKTLDAIESLGDDNGTIIAFKKNTQSLQKGCFQIALAVEENDTVSMQLGVFFLESKNRVTQILFFKSSKDETKLTYNSRNATINAERYAGIRDAVAKKLGDEFEKNVGEIEI